MHPVAKHKVLDVGNCGPDHAAIRSLLEQHFDAELTQAHGSSDTLTLMRDQHFALVLINRKLDQDYSDGLEVLKLIKSDEGLRETPVMLVTNYDEHQQLAIAAGAVRGFGKLELNQPETHARLAQYLA